MILGKCLFCKKEFRKREKKYKFCSLICSNNFNKNGLIKVNLPPQNDLLAEFIGICLGDGYVSKYQTQIILNSIADKDYAPYVISLIQTLFPILKISLMKRRNENALSIRINSIIVSNFLMDMGIIAKNKRVPLWILENISYRKACIRGLCDTEGSISFKKYKGKYKEHIYKQLNFTNTNLELKELFTDTLIRLGLKPTITPRKAIYLSNNHDIDTFRKEIGFSNPKLLKRSLIYNINEYHELVSYEKKLISYS